MAIDPIRSRMRASGKRMTVQRRAVLEAVVAAKHHTTADDIAIRVRSRYPSVDASTVYRNLEALESLGLVTHTHLDDRVTRWHRADSERHGHLVCRTCGVEREISLGVFGAVDRRLRTDYGFEPDLAHSAIVGVCADCAGR